MKAKKPKKNEKLSILIFKENDYSKVYKKKVNTSVIKYTLYSLAIFFIVSSVSFYFLFNLYSEREQMLTYGKENELLKLKIAEYRNQIDKINEKIVYLDQLENKVRNLSKVVAESDTQLAIGGKEVDLSKDLSAVSKRKEKQYFEDLNETLASLSTKLQERENSLSELVDMLEEQRLFYLSTPSILPVNGWISSKFGYRISPFTNRRVFHEGVDIASMYGSDIKATANGLVIFAGYKPGYGNMVSIDHGFGFVTRYGHNSKLLVKVGDRVSKGDVIAKVGSSGKSTGPHCHYEVLVNGVPVNPLKFVAELEEQK
ncbi:peptidoglycan DD-metalloendopeptidase family protein [Deferribacterales bacterium Es71-Z0220]|uniref:M23 family metallopeptidase n=1 Tax=Deferrivibrio essentukiensis TaxID=2880922 RepID=UPI001F61560F|nr:M23 family metallopeptidase [Deferrivibrio essentukiensis]MCB4203907.1 peptidoglycan DD-metalloendopeptidase family protein [Deferrivibrio essentukiensis]